jgi:hypothetical protein
MSDKNAEKVEGLVVRGSPEGGRRTYSRTAKRTLVQLCLRRGVSVAALALGAVFTLARRASALDTAIGYEPRVCEAAGRRARRSLCIHSAFPLRSTRQ